MGLLRLTHLFFKPQCVKHLSFLYTERETVCHCFLECHRLSPLILLLARFFYVSASFFQAQLHFWFKIQQNIISLFISDNLFIPDEGRFQVL